MPVVISSALWSSIESSTNCSTYGLASAAEGASIKSTESICSLPELSNLASLLVALLWNPPTSLSSILQHWNSPSDPFAPLRAYIHNLLEATRVSSSVVILALKYLHRLRSRSLKLQSAQQQLNPSLSTPTIAFLLCLVFSNKFADDERFTNAAWASVGGISLKDLNAAERDALSVMDYRLVVSESDYAEWLEWLMKVVAEKGKFDEARDAKVSVAPIQCLKKRKSVDHPSLTLTPITPSNASDYYSAWPRKKRTVSPINVERQQSAAKTLPSPALSCTPPATVRARSASLRPSPLQQQQFVSQYTTPVLSSHFNPSLPSHLATPFTPLTVSLQARLYTPQTQRQQVHMMQHHQHQSYNRAPILLPTQSTLYQTQTQTLHCPAHMYDLTLGMGLWGGKIELVGC